MAFRDAFAAITRQRQPLAPFTHLHIGGPAEYLVEPRDARELAAVLAACHQEKLPFRVLGIGTNLLVRDGGVLGVVVRLVAPEFTAVTVEGKTVRAGGGASLTSLISAACLAELAGFETLVGITATVGGALRCNAGDRSGEIADNLVRLTALSEAGKEVVRERADIKFGDHASDINDPVIVAVEFTLERDQPAAIVKRMRRAWINRKADQPLSHQAAIRAFKNPHGQSAATLVERAGLVRTRLGAAEVSDRNANYIVAHPGTTAADVLALAVRMRETVQAAAGVDLEQEFKVW